ncbi:ectoine hydroxylase [Hahella ganghwensis]|uniref:ectoine hydroxylase n=1 Tax=Hahella ganghwensis TaxID=286420 RepID=UPI00036FBCD6|nr:ectoine hydroxylase [Hahella ganghwensis]
MTNKAETNQNNCPDIYPSRDNCQSNLMERLDPVVYSDPRQLPDARHTSSQYFSLPLSRELIYQYEDQGFLMIDNVFSPEEIKSYQDELEALRTSHSLKGAEETITEKESGDIRSIFKVHEFSQIFRQLMQDSRLVELARFILNDDIYIHQSRINYKPGFRGREFYWHSDFETWHVEDGMPRMRALSISITLTENQEYNGPLMLIPGSHRYYVSCEGETPSEHFKGSLKKQELGTPSDEHLQYLVKRGGIARATGKPGSVTVFDCNTMHGSNGNISPLPRSNVFMVYNAMSNQVVAPFCHQPPRPEYISARRHITPITNKCSNI